MEYGDIFYKFDDSEGFPSISKRIYLCNNIITNEKIFVNNTGLICTENEKDLYKSFKEIEKVAFDNLKRRLDKKFKESNESND
jgi:hypothetical protein